MDERRLQALFWWCFVLFAGLNFARIVPNALISLAFVALVFAALGLGFRSIVDSRWELSAILLSPLRPIWPWLMLMIGLIVSLLWSSSPMSAGLTILFEYRVLILIPVFTLCLMACGRAPEQLLHWVWIAGTIGVGALYLEVVFPFEGILHALRPRGSHIIGGMIVSVYVAVSLWAWLHKAHSPTHWRYLVMAILGSVYVLALDSGRTGYLQIVSVWIVFFSFVAPSAWRWPALAGICFTVFIVFAFAEMPRQRVILALVEAQTFLSGQLEPTSVGLRLQWLSIPWTSLIDGYWFGVGVGDYEQAIDQAVLDQPGLFATDNLHSEFANMTLMLGLPGLILYVAIFAAPLSCCYFARHRLAMETSCLVVMVISTFFVSSLFNSALKDFGEKNLLMVILPLIFYMVERGTRLTDVSS